MFTSASTPLYSSDRIDYVNASTDFIESDEHTEGQELVRGIQPHVCEAIVFDPSDYMVLIMIDPRVKPGDPRIFYLPGGIFDSAQEEDEPFDAAVRGVEKVAAGRVIVNEWPVKWEDPPQRTSPYIGFRQGPERAGGNENHKIVLYFALQGARKKPYWQRSFAVPWDEDDKIVWILGNEEEEDGQDILYGWADVGDAMDLLTFKADRDALDTIRLAMDRLAGKIAS